MNNYNLLESDYQIIFPENLKKYKNLQVLAIQVEKILKEKIISEISKLAIFKNLEEQSDEILSELAWQFVIDNWQESLSRDIKINLIKNAYWAHSTKGTKLAIEENLKKLSYPVAVKEWFEYGGKPFTFKAIAKSVNKDPDWIDYLIEKIEKYKNCRSVLEVVDLEINREIKEYKIGGFKTLEIEKEYIGMHYDKEKIAKTNFCGYRVIEMEVEKCLKD